MIPTVTAVVVNFHGAEHTVLAAHSILDDADEAVTVVVVDNSDSPAEQARLRDRLPARAKLIVAPTNLGFGKACNLAVEREPSDLVWLVNPDARVLPGCLAALRQALDRDPGLGAVAPLQYLDADRRWLFSPAWLPTSIDEWVRGRALRESRQRDRFDRAVRAETVRLWTAGPAGAPLRQRALSGSNLMLRRACVDPALGLFDPAYFMYFEDSDLCMRLRRQRWRMAVVASAPALHLWHLGSYKDDLMAQARPLYVERHFATGTWPARPLPAPDLEPGPPDPGWPEGDWTVPPDWQAAWSLEVSPTPLFSPCIGRIGQGPVVPWPTAVVVAMPGVRLYARLGPVGAVGRPQRRCIG